MRMEKVTNTLLQISNDLNQQNPLLSLEKNDIDDNDLIKIKYLTGGLAFEDADHLKCTALLLPSQNIQKEIFKKDDFTPKAIIEENAEIKEEGVEYETLIISTAKHCVIKLNENDSENTIAELLSEKMFFKLEGQSFPVVKLKLLDMDNFENFNSENVKQKIKIQIARNSKRLYNYNDLAYLKIKISPEDISNLKNNKMIKYENDKISGVTSLTGYIKTEKEPNEKKVDFSYALHLAENDDGKRLILTPEIKIQEKNVQENFGILSKYRDLIDNTFKFYKIKSIPSIPGRSGATIVKCLIETSSIKCNLNSIIYGVKALPGFVITTTAAHYEKIDIANKLDKFKKKRLK